MTVGTRAQVWHGTADKTSGGLTKQDLTQGKDGSIKSKAQVAAGKSNPGLKQWRAAVKQAGGLKKGTFTPVGGALLTKTRKIYEKKMSGK
jgi:hypothetical protein